MPVIRQYMPWARLLVLGVGTASGLPCQGNGVGWDEGGAGERR